MIPVTFKDYKNLDAAIGYAVYKFIIFNLIIQKSEEGHALSK